MHKADEFLPWTANPTITLQNHPGVAIKHLLNNHQKTRRCSTALTAQLRLSRIALEA